MVRWFENTVQHFCLAAVAGFRGNVEEHQNSTAVC